MGENSTITSVSLGRGPAAAPAGRSHHLVLLAMADDPLAPSSRHRLDDVDEVRFARGPRQTRRTTRDGRHLLELATPDRRMSADHGRLVRGPEGWVLDDPHSKNGAVVDGELTRRQLLRDGALIELGHTFFLFHTDASDPDAPDDLGEDELDAARPALATFSSVLADRFRGLARVARTGVSIVLLGETGTGKELVARAVHEISGRRGAFVAVNCGALPATLIEAELFGHRRGAFSGAVLDRGGLVRAAEAGTLLLDEVGELPPASQVAFLRVLQEREVLPIGEDRPVKVDVRVCAATLRDLDAMVAAGSFRPDFLSRLLGFSLELPPLRQRRADLGLLLRALLRRLPGGDRTRIAPAALRAILCHDWPLNIRQLEGAITRALALVRGDVIEPGDLPRAGSEARAPGPTQDGPSQLPAEPSPDDEVLRARLVSLLTVHEGNVLAVAESLGKRRMQVYRWARRFGIRIADFRR